MIAAPTFFSIDPVDLSDRFIAVLHRYFRQVEEALGDNMWLTGGQFTIADIYGGAMFHWAASYGFQTSEYRNFLKLSERFEERTSVKAARASEAAANMNL